MAKFSACMILCSEWLELFSSNRLSVSNSWLMAAATAVSLGPAEYEYGQPDSTFSEHQLPLVRPSDEGGDWWCLSPTESVIVRPRVRGRGI
jgi:hypothetical protein